MLTPLPPCSSFEEMVEAGITPDAVTYSILIGAAGKALNLELAFAYYEQLKEDAAAARLGSSTACKRLFSLGCVAHTGEYGQRRAAATRMAPTCR